MICKQCEQNFQLKQSYYCGPLPVYCSNACRQKAYRQRKALQVSQEQSPSDSLQVSHRVSEEKWHKYAY